MAEFDPAFDHTLGHEGGYVDDPDDRGGETFRGISRRFHPDWAGWEILDRMTLAEKRLAAKGGTHEGLDRLTRALYKVRFWDVLKLDDLRDQRISEELFDTAVNQGPGVAARYLQEALNLLNRDEADYPDISEDGIIGPITLGLVNRHRRPFNIYITLNGLQFELYKNLAENDPTQEKFFNGWLNRVRM